MLTLFILSGFSLMISAQTHKYVFGIEFSGSFMNFHQTFGPTHSPGSQFTSSAFLKIGTNISEHFHFSSGIGLFGTHQFVS